jgi:queuine/archaeosine tRNA-ribosyltransferase
MKEIRSAIREGRLSAYTQEFMARWNSGEEDEQTD